MSTNNTRVCVYVCVNFVFNEDILGPACNNDLYSTSRKTETRIS